MNKKLHHFEDPLLIFQELIKVAQSNPGNLYQTLELILPNLGDYDRGSMLALLTSFEENDLKAMGQMKKAVRLMKKSVNEIHVHRLLDYPSFFEIATNKNQTGYIIQEIETGNVYEYFPKANKLHSRKLNKWFENGHKSLIAMLNKVKKQ